MTTVSEKLFETAITDHLVAAGGYRLCKWGTRAEWSADFDPALGFDTVELFSFIEETQSAAWSALVKAHGNDSGAARKQFLQRLASQIDERGTVDVLRYGLTDQGITIRVAFFKPAHGLTEELVTRYAANRLTVTRQLPYESGATKTLDTCLFLNGIPVATAELKNKLTGQNIEHAIHQYRADRDPKNVTLARRALVHFAVDQDLVAMTTKLAGGKTQFLPFNLGNAGGAGNPVNPSGHKTAYLWERVWAKDAWMDLLGRFIHVQRPAKGSVVAKKAAETVIFPRFHQWDAVLKLESAARTDGAGHSYLLQHSAGSGKSNTIAWTAHRLSSLHDAGNQKVFDKVVVITDRVVLDRQLQDTIYQFEHAWGVVEKIDKDSTQLANALLGEQARIIITTLQKFPFVLDKLSEAPARRYAVIVDEAHSSQTGEAAKDLRVALGSDSEQELTVAEAEDSGIVAEPIDPVEEALAKSVGARQRQPNLSFFAFTATPKARTLELFGRWNPETLRYEPFHLYSMRQAIEEGFILDVLANYTTYKTFWKIEKTIAEDPNYQSAKARRAIARFVTLHPYNLAQKAEIVVEHFRANTAHKIGGEAKAMVVTSSRLHAVRYKQALDKYIHEKGYADLRTLVAFSGRVIAAGEPPYSESNMNGFPESETVQRFGTGEHQVLIVAEKFQTGFDQPLLHTMYVDKVLSGLAAVQTLSRLNRIHPLKSDTFVLDFRNTTDDIVEAFEPYYGRTVAPPTDPNLLWDTRHRLEAYGVLRDDEITSVAGVLARLSLDTDPRQHGAVYAALGPARERFEELEEDDQLAFRDLLNRFVRTYAFLSQVVSFSSTVLERDYLYCRALAAYLRDASTSESLDLGAEVALTHLRNEMTFTGVLSLEDEDGEVAWKLGEETPAMREPAVEPLSKIVDILNERFGITLTDADQLLFDQFEESWAKDPELGDQARSNTLDNFKLVFDPKFLGTIIARMDENDAIYKQILDDAEFKGVLSDFYLKKLYKRLRGSGEGTSP
ncbi:MAG: type I restriction endonuclease subunit R [Deltaproteobacteria bacterium]|nr:type I restriction endonuclease subunit R [Deltaproteobacteria bacterium]